MYKAYAEHRPFVLSPDMIWLLISQGVSQHVNSSPDQARHFFVDFDGKKELVVKLRDITPSDNPNRRWEELFPLFTQKIVENLKDDLVEVLSADFSTTTSTEKIASEITIMDAVKPYFEYSARVSCGIPRITLRVTTEDWEKVRAKAQALAKYDLEWWTDELDPILTEFINASKGKIDTAFWMNMFKRHTPEEYGVRESFDGWIVKFFPYTNEGQRLNLKSITRIGLLNSEMVKVDLKIKNTLNKVIDTLELWAGFIGLQQNKDDYSLTPQIGWMIRQKGKEEFALVLKDNRNNWFRMSNASPNFLSTFLYDMSTRQTAIKNQDKQQAMEGIILDFPDSITVPDKITTINSTKRLYLNGRINQEEIVCLRQRFPNIQLFINNRKIPYIKENTK